MPESKNGGFLNLPGRISRPNPPPPILVATLGVTAAALTVFDLLTTIFRLFDLHLVALAILNLAVFFVNIVLIHLTIAASGGRPPSRRLAAGGGAAGYLVWRAYALAKLAVFLTGALIILLVAAEPHTDRFVGPT